MNKYEVLDKNGKKIKIDQRIPEKSGKWWYFTGYGNSIKILVKEYLEDDDSKIIAVPAERFNVQIKELPDYNKITRQGHKILAKWKYDEDLHIVIRRDQYDGTKDYAWCTFYDVESGTWAQGHYDYNNFLDAQKALLTFMYNSYVK